MKYEIRDRWSGAVIFTAEIECAADATDGVRLGLAVRMAVKAGADLSGVNLSGVKWRDGAPMTRAPLQISSLPYYVIILDAHMQIGCELHLLCEWDAFDDERIARMGGLTARRFLAAWKAPLLAMARADGRSFEAAPVSEAVA